MNIGKVPLTIFLLLITNDLLDTTAQLLIKKSGCHPGEVLLWVGILIYVFNFFLWMRILSKIDLSVALPLAGLSYIFVPLASFLFLHEHIGFMRAAGLLFILLGIHLISKHTPAQPEGIHV